MQFYFSFRIVYGFVASSCKFVYFANLYIRDQRIPYQDEATDTTLQQI